MTILYVGGIILLVYILALLVMRIKLDIARKNGDYPEKGNIGEDDVNRLVFEGQTVLAIRAYRELHRCGLIKAKHAINAMKSKES